MPAYIGATINEEGCKRWEQSMQEPIGMDTNPAGLMLATGGIGAGFSHKDTVAQFAPGTQGFMDTSSILDYVYAIYATADVVVPAGTATCLVNLTTGHITAITGGGYTCPFDLAIGESCWLHELPV